MSSNFYLGNNISLSYLRKYDLYTYFPNWIQYILFETNSKTILLYTEKNSLNELSWLFLLFHKW